MTTDLVLTARRIITVDPDRPSARALAVSADGTIVAVGTAQECRAAVPHAEVRDLGDTVLAPGFVEAHSHPFASGVVTQPPVVWIAPYAGCPTWDDVVDRFESTHAAAPAGQVLLFNGLDRLLHGCPPPDADGLDAIFGDRPVVVADNSGHAAYATTAMLDRLGWLDEPPEDPPAGSFGRRTDGSLDGRAFEVPAMMALLEPAMAAAVAHPLHSAGQWYALMARAGITTTSDMAYAEKYRAGYEALAAMPSCPLRISLYHMSTEPDAGAPFESGVSRLMLEKRGVKLWADGSPWVGNVALSFPYLDTEATRRAGITLETGGVKAMNYTPDQLDAVIDAHAAHGWQLAFHVNGDLALDVVLDAYERGLEQHGLVGTDHRWRVEHCGAARREHFDRAAALGVIASLGPFQFIYWGDLLDGQLFDPEIGANWMRWRDAAEAGVRPSFHNDGSVSPPLPLLNIQTAVTRTTSSGTVRGAGQTIGLDAALRAQTIDAAFALGREHELGSLQPGKLADLVELTEDPYEVPPEEIASKVAVRATWLGGERIDLDAFLAAARASDPATHGHLARPHERCC